ncbi:MAG: HAD family hydrolase [Candidatus Micrarchaeota archaeon]
MVTKAIAFDIDGTILDSLTAVERAFSHAMSVYGFNPQLPPEAKELHGSRAIKWLKALVPKEKQTPELLEEMLSYFRSRYYGFYLPSLGRTRLDLSGVLPRLAEKYKLGICTNNDAEHIYGILEEFNLKPFFSAWVGVGDAPHAKPAPDLMLELLDRLKVDKSELVFVGDTAADQGCASAAGVRFFFIKHANNEGLQGEKVDSFAELEQILATL